jgi:hypothetical protein
MDIPFLYVDLANFIISVPYSVYYITAEVDALLVNNQDTEPWQIDLRRRMSCSG